MRKKHSAKRATITVSGVDRFDNYDDYTKANSISCCTMCNKAKSDKDAGEFLGWVKRVFDHSIDGGLARKPIVTPKRYRLLASKNYQVTKCEI